MTVTVMMRCHFQESMNQRLFRAVDAEKIQRLIEALTDYGIARSLSDASPKNYGLRLIAQHKFAAVGRALAALDTERAEL